LNAAVPPVDQKSVLCVSTGGLGDAVLFSPVLKALGRRYPKSRIELLLANPLAQTIYAGAREVDRTILLPLSRRSNLLNFLELFRFAVKSRLNRGYDVAVFATGIDPRLSVFLKTVAGIRYMFHAPAYPTWETDLACNVALARLFDEKAGEDDTFIPTTKTSESELERVLKRHDIRLGEKGLIAVYPSTELPHRPRWGLSGLVEVMRRIKRFGFQGQAVVVGSSAEGRRWVEADAGGVVDFNLAGRLSILGSASLLKRCVLTVGNDGGLMHVAGAVNSPLVDIMTNTPESYRPPGTMTKIVHSKLKCCNGLYPNRPSSCRTEKCKNDISPTDVFQACWDMLSDLRLLKNP